MKICSRERETSSRPSSNATSCRKPSRNPPTKQMWVVLLFRGFKFSELTVLPPRISLCDVHRLPSPLDRTLLRRGTYSTEAGTEVVSVRLNLPPPSIRSNYEDSDHIPDPTLTITLQGRGVAPEIHSVPSGMGSPQEYSPIFCSATFLTFVHASLFLPLRLYSCTYFPYTQFTISIPSGL